MSTWANPIVARIAKGDYCAGEFCGLVLNCSWPMPDDVLTAADALCATLRKALPECAYLYPPTTLHCT
eukprot:CAMPEP_0183360914 /NCGR_PEP_ID=MMETSP0164_2-20130417/56146_1 /TAXON_ID=221442 /ORGANISM="Coccolithus pelagicus ssp braarudi, Strain PLY182g" /LENGTH=67 /DNA_ID=CAMNT_0025535361 /DNA_START=13 /DNA_END=213 /DNA_ORIENTATION=+